MAKKSLFPNNYENSSIKVNVRSDTDDEVVQEAIKVIQDNQDIKIERDNKNQLIMQMFEQGFSVQTPTGTKKISSKLLYQALWKLANRMKPLDFQVHGTNRPDYIEKIVTAAIGTVLENSGFVQAMRDKGGLFQRLLMFGDAFFLMSASDNADAPINFDVISNSNIYVDPYAVSIRGTQPATKMAVIFSYSYEQVREMYPKKKDTFGAGRIPRDTGFFKEQGRTFLQSAKLEDITEVCHFFDISNNVHTVMVGSACTIVDQRTGDDYGFIKDGDAYIPVGQFICMPAIEGFYNHGTGDMLYDLGLLTQRLMNMQIGHVEDNTYPLTLINVPQGEAGKFFQKMKSANELRAAGQKALVAMEYGAGTPANSVSAQSLLTQNLTNEWQLLYDKLEREITRMGINLDEIQRGDNVTASQVLAEEESANSFVKQIMEYNASETQFIVEMTIDMMKKFISKNNKTVLNLSTKIKADGVDIPLSSITLGSVIDELKKNNYFVIVNSRSGAIPSNTMERAQVATLLQTTQPGTPAHFMLMEQLARLNNRDFSIQDFGGGQQQPQLGPGGAPTESPTAAPADTERAVINPYAREQVAAF